MDGVALAATIGGAAVGLAGVAATAWSGWLQRTSARDLADSQQAHERELARGERLFERRAPAYEAMLGYLQVWWERIAATEAVLQVAGQPDPPEVPSQEEFRAMYVRLRTVGSPAVAEGYETLRKEINGFFGLVLSLRGIREQGGGHTPQLMEAWQAVEDKRREVRDVHDRLERLVSDELAAL